MNSKKQIFAWSLYDFANSSYATIILTVAYSVFFKETICGGGGRGDFFWGLSLTLSYLSAVIFSPILGALSDLTGKRKEYLLAMTLLCVIATALLSILRPGMIALGMILFIISFFGFAVGLVFYNAFLLDISNRETLGRVSGFGWALGYLGGLASLGIFYPFISQHQFETTFILTALFFLLFSLPTFIVLKSKSISNRGSWTSHLKKSLTQLNQTRLEISKFRELTKFFIAYFFFNDGLSTVITFSSIYARDTLQMSMKEISLLFFFLQITAFLGAFVSGFWVDRIGAKKTILATLILWIGTVLGCYFAQDKVTFWIVAMIAGLGLGSCQCASRSFVALAIPRSREGEFFGFFAIFTKFSSILGPLLFGVVSYELGQRNAILTVLFFFIAGAALILRVKEEKI